MVLCSDLVLKFFRCVVSILMLLIFIVDVLRLVVVLVVCLVFRFFSLCLSFFCCLLSWWIFLIILLVVLFSSVVVLVSCVFLLVMQFSVFCLVIVLMWCMFEDILFLVVILNRLMLLVCFMCVLLYSLVEQLFIFSMCMCLLYFLLNNVIVLKLRVFCMFMLCILVVLLVCICLLILCLIIVSFLVLIGWKCEKLNCRWFGVISEFFCCMWVFSILCRVVCNRWVVEWLRMVVLWCWLLILLLSMLFIFRLLFVIWVMWLWYWFVNFWVLLICNCMFGFDSVLVLLIWLLDLVQNGVWLVSMMMLLLVCIVFIGWLFLSRVIMVRLLVCRWLQFRNIVGLRVVISLVDRIMFVLFLFVLWLLLCCFFIVVLKLLMFMVRLCLCVMFWVRFRGKLQVLQRWNVLVLGIMLLVIWVVMLLKIFMFELSVWVNCFFLVCSVCMMVLVCVGRFGQVLFICLIRVGISLLKNGWCMFSIQLWCSVWWMIWCSMQLWFLLDGSMLLIIRNEQVWM